MGMDHAKMRVIAEELWAYGEQLEGAWSVEIGPSGPVLAMTPRPKRHAGTRRRIREQLDKQVLVTHPGDICATGPQIEHAAIGRLRLPDAVVIPEHALPAHRHDRSAFRSVQGALRPQGRLHLRRRGAVRPLNGGDLRGHLTT